MPSPLGNGDRVTIYNLSPAKLGLVENLDQNSSRNSRVFQGYDVTFQSRFKGLNVFGGVSFGKQVSNTCEVEDPNFLRYCDQSDTPTPYQTQIKLSGAYTLPWSIHISGSFQSYPGDARNATVDGTILAEDPSLRVNWNVNNAIFSGLTGTRLTPTQVIVPLTPPGTTFLGRHNQLDVRLRRTFQVAGFAIEPQFDVYNALNSGVVLSDNEDVRHRAGPAGNHPPGPADALRHAGPLVVARRNRQASRLVAGCSPWSLDAGAVAASPRTAAPSLAWCRW